jgi:hypothetical protein
MIDQYKEGRHMIVKGRRFTQDLKIIGGRVSGDWWRRQGHLLAVSDVQDILDASPSILVVGTGYAGSMRISKGLNERLADEGIELVSQRTQRAAEVFNHLIAEGRDVAGAFHLTC